MKFLTGFILITVSLFSCSEEQKVIVQKYVVEDKVDSVEVEIPSLMTDEVLESYHEMGLVEVSGDDVFIDLRYPTDNNFMHVVLYDTLDRLFLEAGVADRLLKCQRYLDSIHPGYKLKIFDGVRPISVQREMWNALDSIPAGRRGKYVSNPIFASVHNYGAAIDLTICDSVGAELDMGAGYDDFRYIAFPSREAHFLKTGELSKAQYENRKLLRKVMRHQRFYNIPSEWWHFNACGRLTAEKRYQALLDESGNHRKWVSPVIKKDSIIDSLVVVP